MYKTRQDLDTAIIIQNSINDLVDQTKAVAFAAASIQTRQNDVIEFHQKILACIREYNHHITKCEMSTPSAKAALIELSGLGVNEKALIKPSDSCNIKKIQSKKEEFNGLKYQKGFASLHILSNNIPNFINQGIVSLENCANLLSRSKLKSDDWANVPTDVFDLIREIINQPHLSSLIDEQLEQIRRLMFTAEEMEEQQQQAVADGDMKRSELLYFQKISLQENMISTFNNIFTTIDTFEQDYLVKSLRDVHAIHNKTNLIISDMIKSQEILKKSVEADIKKIKETTSELKSKDLEATKKYNDFLVDSDKLLEENTKQQLSCFSAMMDLEKRINALCDEKGQLVKLRIDTMNREFRRKVALKGFDTFSSDRIQLLINTLQNCDAADEATDIIDEFVCNGCNSIEQHMRAVDDDLKKRRMEVHEIRLSHFRNLYLTLGELQYKKERNLEELDKKIAHIHIQQDVAMDTFNPKAKEFAQIKKEMLKVREEMESQLAVIQDKAVLQIEAFKPTEIVLIKAGKEFVHPVQELEQRNKIRQQKMLEYHKIIGDEKNNSPKKDIDLEEEQRAIEVERASLHLRKPKSGGGVGISQPKIPGVGLTAELDPLPLSNKKR